MRTLLVFTVLVLFSSFADARPRIAIIDNDQGTLDLSTGEICIGARNTCFEGLSLDSGITPFLRDRVRLHACYFNEGSREAPETRGCVSNVIRVFRNIDYDDVTTTIAKRVGPSQGPFVAGLRPGDTLVVDVPGGRSYKVGRAQCQLPLTDGSPFWCEHATDDVNKIVVLWEPLFSPRRRSR